MNTINTPVLLLGFNRPDTLEKVIECVRKVQPSKVFFAMDGPRKDWPNETASCERVKALAKKIDWDCELYTLFREENLGCGPAVYGAISWAFQNVDRLIILEDDILVPPAFFYFCEHCLNKYATDNRVWTINARSHNENDPSFHGYDYTFSIYHHCWGWATWKRVWDGFDLYNTQYELFKKEGGFKNVCRSNEEVALLTKQYDKVNSNPNLSHTSWAFPFDLYCMSNRGLAITPRENLSQNIGQFGTHSSGEVSDLSDVYYGLKASETYTFDREPYFVVANADYDHVHYLKHMKPMWEDPTLVKKISNRLKRLFKK